jgi:SAM-dependent methyltransferase
MNLKAMLPFDLALWDFYCGDTSVKVHFRREDGVEDEMSLERFFRDASEFSAIECKALDLCKGKVLDAGAGTGCHSLALQGRGHEVLAIDIAPHAVEIMKARGVRQVQCVDVFDLQAAGFDTILLMMHGIGLVETLEGLDRFLVHTRKLLKPDGSLIFDSLDVRGATEAVDQQYLESKRKVGIYIGENKSCMDYKGQVGEYFSWLQVDPDTLAEHAIKHGWESKVILQENNGDYLAVLSPKIPDGESK